VLKYLFYDLLVLDDTDYFHFSRTFRAREGINLIDFLYQSCPVLFVFFSWLCGFQNTGYPFILVLFFPFSPADVAVISIVTNHLLPVVRNM